MNGQASLPHSIYLVIHPGRAAFEISCSGYVACRAVLDRKWQQRDELVQDMDSGRRQIEFHVRIFANGVSRRG